MDAIFPKCARNVVTPAPLQPRHATWYREKVKGDLGCDEDSPAAPAWPPTPAATGSYGPGAWWPAGVCSTSQKKTTTNKQNKKKRTSLQWNTCGNRGLEAVDHAANSAATLATVAWSIRNALINTRCLFPKRNGLHDWIQTGAKTAPLLHRAPAKVLLPFQIIVELVAERMDAAPVCVSVERVRGSV